MNFPNLKKLRESLGMTQKDFAESLGCNKTTYNNYEAGLRDTKSDFWEAVSDKYGVTVDFLLGLTDDPTPHGRKKNPEPNGFEVNEHERALILAYRNHTDMQPAVDRLLGLDSPVVPDIKTATARAKEIIRSSQENQPVPAKK